MRVNMQRPIKFRGWHPKWKLMTGTPATQSNNFDFTFTAKTNKEPIGEIDSMDDFIIEQYTGLKDKKGVDIYEGDIVQRMVYLVHKHVDSDGVQWSKTLINEPKVPIIDSVRYKKNEFCTGTAALWLGHYEDFEVIGNIHENPELLAQPPAQSERRDI